MKSHTRMDTHMDTSGAIDLQSNGTTKVSLDSSGNLEVNNGNFTIDKSASPNLLFNIDGTEKGYIRQNANDLESNSGSGNVLFRTGGTERFRIDQNGDLFGTDTSIGSLSDSRLKENIADYTYSIDTFKQLAPKTFTWKNPSEHQIGTRRGFTAQDVESVDSHWTGTTPIKPDSADYDIITDNISKTSKLGEKDAMYISVIKQLIARIEALES